MQENKTQADSGGRKEPVKEKPKQVKACRMCGKSFTPVGRQIYCSDKCAQHAQDAKRRKKKGIILFKDKPAEERKRACDFCGKEFIRSHPSQTFCSHDCREKSNRQRKKEHKIVRLEKPYIKHKPKYKSNIEAINAEAKARGMTYGQMQAQKRLAVMHEEMEWRK